MRRSRILWQPTQDPEQIMPLNLVAETFNRKIRRKGLEQWKTKVVNSEFIPQALWPIAKPLLKRDGPKAPAALHSYS
jgi:hypothetical protein